ncbi:hypothetical protein [Methylobrevis pamukkalensis]|uniref:Uncharacterized protein n=1 Tax=Methylobrevis pamukkalensis TaxID=1439726 RepID=A0A1E3H4Y5_9HYPH|nr:hypothetical protein [Methylobrevis pamukkalensis]ODN71389.1 hypothetical protein A6302_01253 [Methylobrevis pamukkalensis]
MTVASTARVSTAQDTREDAGRTGGQTFVWLGRYAVHGVLSLAVAFFLTALPVVASEIHKGLAVGAAVLAALLVANFAPKVIPVVIIVSVLFQNLFVALVSPYITSSADFNFVRGFNFLTLVVFFLFFWFEVLLRRHAYSTPFMRYFYASTVVLLIVGLYFAYGW